MTVRFRHIIVMTLAVGIVAGCGNEGPERRPPGAGTVPTPPPPTVTDDMSAHPLKSNQRILTRSESLALIAWANRFRTCMTTKGLVMSELTAGSRQINLPIRRFTPKQALADGVSCGDALGGPPEGSSLQLAKDGWVLYLPVQCLLDARVRRQHS